MAYEPTEWKAGDVITGSKMNKIEAQLAANTEEIEEARGKGGSASGSLGARIDDMIILSDTQPTSTDNEIWIRSSSSGGVVVPTYEELENVKNSIAEVYDSAKTYAIGDYVYYNEVLYRCTTAISIAESWNSGHWIEVKVGSEVKDAKNGGAAMDSNFVKATATQSFTDAQKNIARTNINAANSDVIADSYDATKTYAVGDYVIYNDKLYRCNTTISTAEAWTAAHWTETQIGNDVGELNGIETALFTISDNLFNIDDIYTNKVPGSVGSNYDTMVALNGWYTSNYIPVTDGEQYALIYLNTITQGAIFRIACYSNRIMTYKTSISTEPNPFTIPSGVDHVRFFSNTANLFNNRTNTSFKKYSADMSMAWTPYGKQENFLVKGAMPEYGIYVDGTNYYHFVRFGEKTLIRCFKQEGPNNLFQFSALYTGEVSEHGVSINKTIATNGTDTVGPISIMRQGVDSGGMWSGGWHTRTVNGVTCPTAEQQNLDIKINGESIVGVDGLHYGECVATVVNKLYFPQTITGTDLSTATQAIQETVTYIFNEKMTARVEHKYLADTRVILYYGMQAVRIGFDKILLPNNEMAFAFADMNANVNLAKAEDLMQMSNNDWNYDLIMKPFGLAKYTHNSGAGSTKYGYLPVSTRKVYWALMEGAYDYTFITSGRVLVWEGVWDIYPN